MPANRSDRKIAVVGGGVIGLTTANRILEEIQDVEVTIISENLSPNTTADVSAGFWKPYLCGDVHEKTMKKWLDESFDFFLKLSKLPEAGEIGVGLLSVFDMNSYNSENEVFDGSQQMLGYRSMSEKELRSVSEDARSGKFYTTITAQCTRLLPYLLQRFLNQGGIVIKEQVENFNDLFVGRFDAIVNCSGISSLKLVPDPTVYPIRGQILRVKAPWIKHAVNGSPYHVLPNADFVQLGGTAQKDDWNKQVDPEDTQKILEGCCNLIPSLKRAEVIEVNVGLRPGRKSGPRVESDILKSEDGNSEMLLIHNYGHGGSGVTLSWGCAGTVVEILKKKL